MADPTQTQVNDALTRLGHYRVVRAQEVVDTEAKHDGLRGSHLLALGLRETWGRNIEGGAKKAPDGRWVAETDPTRMDVGFLQISRRYHSETLKTMPGVKVGTWDPVVTGKSANDGGYVPRFTDSLRWVVPELDNMMDYGYRHGVPGAQLLRFAVAAHNAGVGGALDGFRAGNVDKYTAGADYSSWVLRAVPLVDHFITTKGWVYHP